MTPLCYTFLTHDLHIILGESEVSPICNMHKMNNESEHLQTNSGSSYNGIFAYPAKNTL